MRDDLLTTKLYIPPVRSGLVHRPRLIRKLDHGLQQGSRLTFISAPAGYGKTTLVSEWLESLGRPSRWLSLDRADNHPVQFFTYLSAALQGGNGSFGETIRPELGGPAATDAGAPDAGGEWLLSRLPHLINQVSAAPEPFILVLDDYHSIYDLAIHQAIAYWIEHQPVQMHLVITTRQDPMLPLSRLRSRGQVTEIRLGELRFTQEEAEFFLNETMRLGLDSRQVASLETRTEGWITGLQLAALSLSEAAVWGDAAVDPSYRSRFIDAFAGDDRHVVDYLLDEVLSRQPKEVQRFLLETSILNRLSGPLCDTVLNVDTLERSNVETFERSNDVLEYLDRSNLFIIPLDSRRQWYRYHHLFADLLSSRLRYSDPMHVLTLHSRASQWFEREGLFSEAVDHALLADDFPGALRLIEQQASRSIWASGDLPILINWSKRLPEEELMARPRLSLYTARGLFFSGQVEVAKRYLQGAERALLERDPHDETTAELLGVLFTNQATFAAMFGESEVALNLVQQAQPLVAAGDTSTQARIAHAIGMAEYLQGNVQKALPAFSRAVGLCRQSGNRVLGLDVVALLGQMLLAAGRIGEALKLLEDELGRDPGVQQFPAACAVYLALAEIQYEKDDLYQAKSAIERSLELGQKANWPHILWQIFLLQTQVEAAFENWDEAQAFLLRAEILSSKYPIPHVNRMVLAASARMQMAGGDLTQAASWAEEYLSQRTGEGLHDFEELTLAGILCAQNRFEEALAVLDSLSQFAASTGRKRTEIQAMAFRSRILSTSGKPAVAQETLTAARQLAGLEPFARSFTDFCGLTGEALKTVRVENASKPGLSNMVVSRNTIQPLLEPLSEREVEVLALMAAGFSNPEIAARLYLSVNTLRAHSSNIFRKLDVHNRVQAVTRGRELGLLPDQ